MLSLLSIFNQLFHIFPFCTRTPYHLLSLTLLMIHATLYHVRLLADSVISLVSNHSLTLFAMPSVLLLNSELSSPHNHCLWALNHKFLVKMSIAFNYPCLVCSPSVESIEARHTSENQDHGSAHSAIEGGKVLSCCLGH